MELNQIKFNADIYQSPKKTNWTGRATNPHKENQYWHQEIELIDLNEIQINADKKNTKVALLGYACDEGVQRNLGRKGAIKGPKAIRERLAKLPFHHRVKSVIDCGDINCINTNMENSQKELSKTVSYLLHKNVFPIIIGGGHDVSFGHFNGIWNHLKNYEKPKIGIINFDAHFDLRDLDQANSGTPFNQILKEYNDFTNYFVLGIQQQSNTKELFDLAKHYKVEYLFNYECVLTNFEEIKTKLSSFVEKHDWIYITIDMDGFSSAYAPGVSAPSPLGFTPYFIMHILKYLLETKKIISCDIAELNPSYDRDNSTANLAARLADFIISNV